MLTFDTHVNPGEISHGTMVYLIGGIRPKEQHSYLNGTRTRI